MRRSRGEGAIYQTKDKRWRGRLVVELPDGRKHHRYVSGRSKAEAVRELEKVKRETASRGFATETVSQYLGRWIAARTDIRHGTLREYRRHVARWQDAMGSLQLTKLSPGHVDAVLAKLTPNTARAMRTTLRKALHDAQRERLVIDNAAALARPPRVVRKELRPLSYTEVRRMIDHFQDEPIYVVAVSTGLRLAELLDLTWDDIDFIEYRQRRFVGADKLVVRRTLQRIGGEYRFEEPKTARSRRTVMLPDIAAVSLRHQKAAQAAWRAAAGGSWQDNRGLVFTDKVGRPLSPFMVSAGFRQWARSVGLPARFHDLRHTAASLMLGAGVPLKVVSEALGHASIAITADVYAHVTPELRREAAEAIDRALAP